MALGYEAANLLAGWVAIRGREAGNMFYSLDKFGGVRSNYITDATVHAALKQAGIPPIAPQELRRASLARLFEHGVDVYAVADIAGYASLAQTEAHRPPHSTNPLPPVSHGETPFHKW